MKITIFQIYMRPLRSYFPVFTIFSILFLCNGSRAQTIPDSLTKKLNSAVNDSVKARTLLDIGEAIEEISPKKSLDYYNRALQLSTKITNNSLIVSSLNNIGISYIESNKMDSALFLFDQAIPVARSFSDSFRLAKIMANIGNVYLHKKDRARAIEYYMQSARLWERCADQTRLSVLYSNINSLMNFQKEYAKALEYGNKAVELAQKNHDNFSLTTALLNLSTTYSYLEQYEKQLALLDKALPLAKKNEDLEQVATIFNNLGDYYFKKDNYQLSLEKYLESYTYSKQLGNRYHLCTASSMLALLYHKLNQNDKARQYILQAESMAGEVGERADLKEIFLTRGEIEQETGNYKKAAEYFSKTIDVSDSVFKAATSEKVAEVEAKYQNEKKQLAITQLEKDKKIQALSLKEKSNLNNFLIAAVIVLSITGALAYLNIRHRHLLAKKETELQQQQIRELEKDKQLVAVDSMLKGQEEERSRLAKDLHDGLGGLLSGVKYSLSNMKDNLIITPDNMSVFERSLDMIDASIKELRRVAHNMMPEMLLQFGLDEALKEYCNMINTTGMLTVKYQSVGMDARTDRSVEIIIYRIVQELLNNTMKHAGATEAFVQLVKENDRLNVVMEDNGKGFDTAALKDSKGGGFKSIQSRVDYLKGRLDVNSGEGKGTLINIEFNI